MRSIFGILANQFELTRNGQQQNISSMEGLRGFAVFLVFLVHYAGLSVFWLEEGTALWLFSEVLYIIGNVGVDLFFVLSGYLIYGALIGKQHKFVTFIMRRARRIYPVFLVVFVTYLVLSFVFPTENKIPMSPTGGGLYLLQNLLLLPGIFPIQPMITVAWSLSYEFFYYLVMPLIVVLLRLRTRSSVWRIVFFGAAAALLTGYCAVYGGPIRMVMFVAGILLFEIIQNTSYFPPSSAVVLAVLAVGIASPLLPWVGFAGVALKALILFASFFLVCFSCFKQPKGVVARMAAWTPLRWLGNMSYSYYLIHGLTLKACFLVLGKILPPPLTLGLVAYTALGVAFFVVTLLPSAALFIFIEKPFSLTPAGIQKTSMALRIQNQ